MKTITDITPVQKKEGKIRLAAYCRVSSNSEDQLHSYATQIRYYSNYTKQHTEYELVDIYADEGLTGTEMEKREDLSRLLKDCKNGKVDRIIVKSISRFARNTEELLEMIRALKDIGVALRKERKKKLTDDEGCGLLDELRLLNELLKEYKPNGRFDEQLFEQIIDKIIVVDSTQLKFHLIGGVILTEPICEKGRCDVA